MSPSRRLNPGWSQETEVAYVPQTVTPMARTRAGTADRAQRLYHDRAPPPANGRRRRGVDDDRRASLSRMQPSMAGIPNLLLIAASSPGLDHGTLVLPAGHTELTSSPGRMETVQHGLDHGAPG